MSILNIPLFREGQKDIPKLSPFASSHDITPTDSKRPCVKKTKQKKNMAPKLFEPFML